MAKCTIIKKILIPFIIVLNLNVITFANDINYNPTIKVKNIENFNNYTNGTTVINQMIGNNTKYAIENTEDTYFAQEIEDKIIDLTNDFRKENGLPSLSKSEVLRFSARYKNLSMLKYNYFEHTNPNMGDCHCGSLLDNLGCTNWNTVGENIYKKQTGPNLSTISAYEIFDAWKNSEGHRKNMLDDIYTYIGVSVSFTKNNDGSITFLSTQHFFGNKDAGIPINKELKLDENFEEITPDINTPTLPEPPTKEDTQNPPILNPDTSEKESDIPKEEDTATITPSTISPSTATPISSVTTSIDKPKDSGDKKSIIYFIMLVSSLFSLCFSKRKRTTDV